MASENSGINYYVSEFCSLNTNRRPDRYPEATKYSSPHKPLLLLSVIDIIAEGELQQNQVTVSPLLRDLFSQYWARVILSGRRGNIAMPFYHLNNESFWSLIPKPKSVRVLESGRRLKSVHLLHKHTRGAKLDDELFALLSEHETREVFRASLIETYFSEEVREDLIDQGTINIESFSYSQQLLQQARNEDRIAEYQNSEDMPEPVRDQGFRRAVVETYNHRCAISGIRILTSDLHTAVDAAHIIPWSISHNDRPQNGIALTKLCHWAFEKGLITVTQGFEVRLSPELTARTNAPGYLGTLQGRRINTPEDGRLSPEPDYLKWHEEEVFRR